MAQNANIPGQLMPLGNAVQPGNAAQPDAQLIGGAMVGQQVVNQGQAATFQGLFSDPARDPCQGDYGRIMQRFAAEGAYITDGMALFWQATTATRPVLQAYLVCIATTRGPRIYCVHSPGMFTAALDGTVTPWDDQAYAFLGEPV